MKSNVFFKKRIHCDLRQLRFSLIIFFLWLGITVPALAEVNFSENTSFETGIKETSQQKKIHGTILSVDNEPVIGANVSIEGTTRGTLTDVDGKFSLEVNDGDVIKVSCVGYIEQKLTIGAQTEIKITLQERTEALDEVVVVGYGSQKKVNLTGSVASVQSDQIQDRTFSNVQQAIQGQIAGLTVTQTGGQPGNENMNMSIRGKSTFSTNNPLVIVDGQTISMANLNPQDIESVTVLKDAAAAAIYGARASGGVILVTTKRGKAGKVTVSYSGNIGIQKAITLPDMVNAYDHARLFREAQYNDNPETTVYEFSLEDIEDYRTGKKPSANRPDYLFGSAIQTQHNVTVTGGSDSYRFLLSLGYLYQDGIMVNSGFKRGNIRLNNEFKITSKLKAELIANFMPSKRNAPSEASFPNGPTRTLGDIINAAYRRPATEPIFTSDGQWSSVTGWANRMGFASEDGGFQERTFNRLNGSFSLTYDIMDGLSIKGSYFGKYDPIREVNYSKRMQFINPNDNETVDFDYTTNSLTIENESNYEQSIQFLANYEKTFKEKHNLKALLGYSMEWNKEYNELVGRRDFLTDDIHVINAGSDDPSTWSTSGKATNWSLVSFFGRVNYDFSSKYLLEANLRYDASSRFSSKVRWGLFPSFSAGWRISEEPFFANIRDHISNLKLRASWGQVGNQNTSALYQHYSTISTSAYYFGGIPQTSAYFTQSVNDRLTWETKTTTNFGIDANFLDNKFSLSFDVFKDRTSDILMKPSIPTTYGMGAPVMNVGVVDNVGWETILTYADRKNDFSWGATFQVSDAKNKVKKMIGSPNKTARYITEVGYEMDMWYGWESIGIFETQEEVDNHAFQNAKTGIGDLKYRNADDSDDKIDANDRVRLGSSRPRFPFGLNLNFGWKGLDFSAFFQGVMSQKTYVRGSGGLPLTGDLQTFQNIHKDRWHQDEDGNWIAGKYPKMRVGGVNVSSFSSFWLQNSSYVRLKNIQLGYSLPKKIVNKLHLSNLRVYFNAENLFTITNMHDGLDPETPDGTGNIYPSSKVMAFGLSLSF